MFNFIWCHRHLIVASSQDNAGAHDSELMVEDGLRLIPMFGKYEGSGVPAGNSWLLVSAAPASVLVAEIVEWNTAGAEAKGATKPEPVTEAGSSGGGSRSPTNDRADPPEVCENKLPLWYLRPTIGDPAAAAPAAAVEDAKWVDSGKELASRNGAKELLDPLEPIDVRLNL